MPERELLLVPHRREPRRSDELAAHELAEASQHVVAPAISHRGEGARPEDLSEHGGVVEQALELGRKRVEPCGQKRLDRLGQICSARRAPVTEHPHELLGVQRVPARALEKRRLRLGGQHRPLEQGRDESRRVLVGQRREPETSRSSVVRLPSRAACRRAPVGPSRAPSAARLPSSRASARRSRGTRRRPSGGPRSRPRSVAVRRAPRGTGARRRTPPPCRRPRPRPALRRAGRDAP